MASFLLLIGLIICLNPISSMAMLEDDGDGEDTAWVEEYNCENVNVNENAIVYEEDCYGLSIHGIGMELLYDTEELNNSSPDGIILNVDTITLGALESYQLTPTLVQCPPNTTVQWISHDPTVATVDSNGLVHALKYGQTLIEARANGRVAYCDVYVRYSDVNNPSKYYFRPVYWMAANGITGGYNGNAEFRPQNNCTRGQYCAFLYKLNGSPSIGNITNPFTDITTSTTHYTAIMWAYSQGLIGGYSDNI